MHVLIVITILNWFRIFLYFTRRLRDKILTLAVAFIRPCFFQFWTFLNNAQVALTKANQSELIIRILSVINHLPNQNTFPKKDFFLRHSYLLFQSWGARSNMHIYMDRGVLYPYNKPTSIQQTKNKKRSKVTMC